MNFLISNSAFPADAFSAMAELPPEYGIEIQIEFGTEYYWKTNLARVLKERTGPLSIHGQFVDIDLASAALNETEILDYYKWAFDMYHRYHAVQFVLHPDGKLTAPASPDEIAQMRQRALERIAKIAEVAVCEKVELLIENLRPKGYGLVFDSEEFIELFRQLPHVGCLIDTGHLYLSGWDFSDVLSRLGSRIKAYHLDDTFGEQDEHLPVGCGAIDWTAFFADYKKYTPQADLVLEYKSVTVPTVLANARLIRTLLK